MLFSKPSEKDYQQLVDTWFSRWGSAPYDEKNPHASNINKDEQKKYREIIQTMADACVTDFKNVYNVTLDYTPDSLLEIDKIITPKTKAQYQKFSSPYDIENSFLILICEIGAYVGEIVARQMNGKWSPVYPYWDSPVTFDKAGGCFPFHWVMKAFSSELSKNGGNLHAKYLAMQQARKTT